MKLLASAILCLALIPVFAQNKYIPDADINISGEPGDYTISNYRTRQVYAKHVKADDISGVYQGLICFRQGDKYGFMNFYGKIIRPAEFDEHAEGEGYGFVNRGIYMEVHKGDQLALLDSMGNYVVPLGNYSYLWDAGKGTCGAAERDGLTGLFRNGKCILPMEYDAGYNTFEFSHETMPVYKDDMMGLINTSGKFVLPLEYSSITELNDSYWLVTKNELTGLADFNGKMLVPCSMTTISNVENGLVYGSKNGLYGVQKPDGTVVCPFEYEYLSPYPAEGSIFAKKDGLWGIMSLKAPSKTQFVYSNFYVPEWNKNNIAVMKKGNKVGLVNAKNEVVCDFMFDPEYERLRFQYGTAIVAQNGLYGMLLENGKLALPCEFDELDLYSDFPKIARKQGKYGVIDLNGTTLVPFEYDGVSRFAYDQDLYRVRKDNKEGLYYAGDKLLIPVEYDYIGKNRGFYEVAKNEKYGFYDEDGRPVLPCLFPKIYDFTPSTALVNKDGILQQYDLTTGKEQKLMPDSVIQFETTSFVNFGKTYIQSSAWNDYFAKNPGSGAWYCIDKKTNALIGKPYYAMGRFNSQGNVAVSLDANQEPIAINSKGEEIKPHFYLDQDLVFDGFVLEDSQDSIISQFQKRDLLRKVTPENYRNHIESHYVVTTLPEYMYDEWGNATDAYYLRCYNKSSYFDSETSFPEKPKYTYNFSEFYSNTGPANEAGLRWANRGPIVDGTDVNLDVQDVVLVNEAGEVMSKPNYNPEQSAAFFNTYSDLQLYWKDLAAYPSIIDSIQLHFPRAASLNYEQFLQQYEDSVYTDIVPVYSYNDYEESKVSYTHSFYKTAGLQLFRVPPPATVRYRFALNDIRQVKGGESLAQPDETHLFELGSKTAYSFGNKRYFLYPVLPLEINDESTQDYVNALLAQTENREIKADLKQFGYYRQLVEAGIATTAYEYSGKDPLREALVTDERFRLYSYPSSVGLAVENEVWIEPRYLAIALDSKAEKFILVDSLLHVYTFDLKKRKTAELNEMSFCSLNLDGIILRSKKTKLFDVYYSGVPKTDNWSGYKKAAYPDICIKNAQRLYFVNNCEYFPLTNMYGEDSMIIIDGVSQFIYANYCDTVVASMYRPVPAAVNIQWYELGDGNLYKFSGEKETEVQFSDYRMQAIPINDYWPRKFRITETTTGLDLKANISGRTLHLSEEEYLAVVDQTTEQNGFGGVFKKGKFIPYSTMSPFPEKHSVYIHLDTDVWLIGDENKLELIRLDPATNTITGRYPGKFSSLEDFKNKRDEFPMDGMELNSVQLFMLDTN